MSDATIDEIKIRLNIVDVIGGYVKLEKAGVHWKACCPFHQERTPSFMVNEEKNMWHCFGCGKGGDVFSFVMEMEGLEFREALTMLAERAGIELPQYKGKAENKETKERFYDILELATKFYEKQLWEGSGKAKILTYLQGRGLSDESIKKFRLGYAPDGWRHLLEFLTKKGFATQEIEQTGLVIKKNQESGIGNHDMAQTSIPNSQLSIHNSGYYDRFRDRIMFPISDIFGRVIGYSARVAPGGDESQAKYINTPETSIYHKSRVLYGLFQGKQAMKQAGGTVIVEGNMDVIAMHQAGIGNTVAVSGTALTSEQLSLMKRYGNEVKLFFDMDGAGQKAARKSAELALEKEFSVSVVALPFGKDAADMGKEDALQLRAVVAHPVPAPRYFLDMSVAQYDRTTAHGKRKIVEEYTTFLAHVKNNIERAHWIKELAKAIQMEERLVADTVNTALLAQERRERSSVPPPTKDTTHAVTPFSKRSELLREELVGIMYADKTVRASLLNLVTEGDVRVFLEQHPLFFFLVQAGEREPLSLIEDTVLKRDATRLSFRALEAPDMKDVSPEERTGKLLALATGYLESLKTEVTKREKLLMLERSLEAARRENNRDLEKQLLTQFARISLDKSEET